MSVINEYLELKNSNSPYGYHFSIKNRGDIFVLPSPHGNCQTASISLFNELLKLSDDIIKKCIIDLWDDYLEDKYQLSLDIESKYQTRIEELFEDCKIVIKTPYISTNKSDMILYLIDIRGITGEQEDDDYYDEDDDY